MAAGTEAAASCTADVIAVARLITSGAVSIDRSTLAEGRLALRIFVRLRGSNEGPVLQTPRRVLHALSALAVLLEMAATHGGGPGVLARHSGTGAQPAAHALSALAVLREMAATHAGGTDALARLSGTDARPAALDHPVVAGLVASILNLARRSSGSSAAHSVADVAAALEKLGLGIPVLRAQRASVISSRLAGLLLLVEPLERLGWPRRWLAGPICRSQGPRALHYLLAGLALSAVGRFSERLEEIDPGLAVFAGFFGEPDLRALRRFFESPIPGGVSEEEPATGSSSSWARARSMHWPAYC